nr:retrotransposon protein, putative, Ty1-copia subclass [Tanacetum cinerariifolium]
MEAYKKVHNETVRFELRMAIVQQSMEMDMWKIKEKLAERQEQMAIRAYEEDRRHEELIKILKNGIGVKNKIGVKNRIKRLKRIRGVKNGIKILKRSISKKFAISWKTGLEVIWMAALLSQKIVIGLLKSKKYKPPCLLPVPIVFFRSPQNILDRLEAIRRCFFWGVKDSQRGICWVKWASILLDANLGGLGVGGFGSLAYPTGTEEQEGDPVWATSNEAASALEVLPADMEAQTKAELNKKAHSVVILCLGLYGRGRTDRRNSRQSRGKSRSKSRGGRLKCYICQSEDHLKRNYPKNNRKKSSGYVNKDDQPSSSGSIYDGFEAMMVMSAEALLDWIMDSGGSYHMTPRLDLFFDFLDCDGGRVLLGDNRECKIRGYVNKDDQPSFSGSIYDSSEVMMVMSAEALLDWIMDSGGITVYTLWMAMQWQSGKIKVINGSRVVLSGTRRDNCVYSLDGHAVAGAGKAGSVWQEESRFKHEAFEKFKEWKQLVENQTGRTVKKLRTDNDVGMPQQNGLAERMNRTLMDKVRCLLIQSGLPKTFWAEATCTAAYLINRSPSTTIEKKTPMEMWSGHPSDYGMLRTFGCFAYSHVQQGKLEPRVVKCVLLGYPEGVKGYRLYRLDNESPKIVTSRFVEVELQRLNNHTLEEDQTNNEDQTDQYDGNDEDAGHQEIDQPPDLIDYQLVRDREPRTRTKPLSSKWKAAMKEEMVSLRKNKTWELVDDQAGQKLMTCKWLFKIKEGIEGVQKPRYKARLVARGFTQRAGIDYNEVFSLIVRHTSIRVILALTTCKDFELEQLDVKTAFLHGNLEEVIYVRQPQGYEHSNKRSSYDICVYYRSYAPGEYIYILLYVDDMLIACKSKVEIGSTKSLLKKEFDMKDLEEAKKILGMEIVRDRSRKILTVSQSGYISKILNNFRIDNGESVQMPLGGHFKLSLKDFPIRDCDVERMSKVSYANAVGSLMYLMVCTRPDIAYAVSIVSRYLANPGKNHWEPVKWILKYLRGTAKVGLIYGTNRGNHKDVTGFVDSDCAKDPDKGRKCSDDIYGYYWGYTQAKSWGCVLEEDEDEPLRDSSLEMIEKASFTSGRGSHVKRLLLMGWPRINHLVIHKITQRNFFADASSAMYLDSRDSYSAFAGSAF